MRQQPSGSRGRVLFSASGLRTLWACGLIAQCAGSERWAQGDRRGFGLRGKFAGGRSQPDYRSVCACRSATVWDYNPPAQSGAGSGQKKTTSPDLMPCLPNDAAAAYETLRLHLIGSADLSGPAMGRVVLLRHGMLAWATTYNQMQASPVSLCQAGGTPAPGVAMELVQIMAGLILSRERIYA